MSEGTESVRLAHRGGVIRVAQLTDMHIEQERGGCLLGMDTDDSLRHVLGLLRSSPPDLLLATGDLANHGSEEAYSHVRDRLDELGLPWLWLPGNHDDNVLMQSVLGRGQPMTRSLLVGDWQILFLDSSVPGEVNGRLGSDELLLLEELLGRREAPHALVCLHHQPVPIGCAWLDEQKVADGEAFLAVLRRHAAVRAVLWGHVHQTFDVMHGPIRLLASPSTCIQFAPGCAGFRLDDCAPGMRWLELQPDGSLTTCVERVEGVRFSFDRDSAGYG